jgi:hypothetical protein
MHRRDIGRSILFASLAWGCASAPSNPQPAAPAGATEDRTAAVLAAANRWTGTLNPTQSHTGQAVTSTRQKAYGSVELTVAPNRPTLAHLKLDVAVPVEPGLNNLTWGLHPGNCGSGNPPLFPPGDITLSVNGRGTVDSDVGFALPESGQYHINVFRGNGTQLSDVITCANLRRQG